MKALHIFCVLSLAIWSVGCVSVAPLTSEQSGSIRSAASTVLTQNAKVGVETMVSLDRETLLVISARLLDGFSSEETDPAVKASYRDLAGLTRAVQLRSAQILRAVDVNGEFPEVERVLVETRHGVRLVRPGEVYGGSDVSKVIYAVSISKSTLLNRDLATLSDEEISTLWRVETNLLPRLKMERPSYEEDFAKAPPAVYQANARRVDHPLDELPLP